MPQTNGIPFRSADDYAEYLAELGFTGASLSGGEPLLTFERTVEHLSAIRRRCGDSIHVWLYTNGTLLTPDKCRRLRDAGLDEIRIDIGAIRYNLKKVKVAVGEIPTVTVEIPAVPEDFAVMKDKLYEMADSGVNYLNLHQLRLTPHNFAKINGRGYTFIHGEKVTVMESELTALCTVEYALDQRIPLPVNYCSFPYKRRFQRAATRRRAAILAANGHEDVTEMGFIRSLSFCGSKADLKGFLGENVKHEVDRSFQMTEQDGAEILFSSLFYPQLSGKEGLYSVTYYEAALSANISNSGERVITLPSGTSIAVIRQPVYGPFNLGHEEVRAILNGDELAMPGGLLDYEKIPTGLAEYF